MMVAGVFFKMGAWMYGAAVGITQLFNLKSKKAIILGLGTIITPLSLVIGSDFVKHLEIGFGVVVTYVHTLLHIILPILFLCIAFIRKKVLV
jgi:spore germination protein KB